jgi:hypothetical protein
VQLAKPAEQLGELLELPQVVLLQLPVLLELPELPVLALPARQQLGQLLLHRIRQKL